MNYLYIYNQLFNNIISNIVENSKKTDNVSKCTICKKIFKYQYKYGSNITFHELDIHCLHEHNIIMYDLYEKIMSLKNIQSHNVLTTNDIYMIDGLFEQGSNKIYIDKGSSIYNFNDLKYSEHYGVLNFLNNKLDKIILNTQSRIDEDDPSIYLPKNTKETIEAKFIFHTHPKTPFIGSRVNIGFLFEFPSISDIIHFIDYHNRGKLLGSIVLTPEGIYNIRKLNFNKNKIKLNYDIFTTDLEEIYSIYHEEIKYLYSSYIVDWYIDTDIKIPENTFYSFIHKNFDFIVKINEFLEKYDITVDFYGRTAFKNKWVIPNIYIPDL